jgi:thiamine kinase-like enzyme
MSIDPTIIAKSFALHGTLVGCERYGNGHINDTYLLVDDQSGTKVRYILQRINGKVFPDPDVVMTNISQVCAHLASLEADSRRRLSLIPTREGKDWLVDAEGSRWRCYPFIEQTRTVEKVERASEAYATARTFARFQNLLASYRGPALREVIVDFHHTPRRLDKLRAAATADTQARRSQVEAELAWVFAQESWLGRLQGALDDGSLPRRITHNDTKINNVLFDANADVGSCVIDLDTLMPGSSLADFGDLVRTATSTAAEDATDIASIDSNPEFYQALSTGWLEELAETITPLERELLPMAGAIMTCEVGIRFLTDYLDGDQYFRIKRPGHNLDRARNQFAMTKAIMRRQALTAVAG